MKSEADTLLEQHQSLTHSEMMKVESHVQRSSGEWIVNTLMLEGIDVAFKYKRKQQYKSLVGQRVNLTYYSAEENIAGMAIEYMKVVRIKRS